MSKMINFIKKYSCAILVSIALVCMLIYVRTDRMLKVNFLKNLYKEEYDNFDLTSHKEYIMSGSFDSIPEDANLANYEPTKTSELVTNCDEKRDTCITN